MDIRKQKILAAIVKEYSETAQPVGSREIMDKYNFKVSSATIRNEMADLEKEGYIYQPHKSAGRVPSDKGYRYFVNQLMRRFELSEKERRMLRDELGKIKDVHEQLGRSISNLLAQVSGQAAFALLPDQTSATGLSQIVDEPEFHSPQIIKEVAEVFDHIDQHAAKLLKQANKGMETFIGKELPIPVPKNLSVIVSRVNLPSGKKGVIGIVGPKRMSYAKNQSLLQYLSKLISGSAIIILIIHAI